MLAPKRFKLVGEIVNPQDYIPVLDQYARGWNETNLDIIVDCFSDDIEYRDLATVNWIRGKKQLQDYVTKVFFQFPKQEWSSIEAYPHMKSGVFSVCYEFKMHGKKQEMIGGL